MKKILLFITAFVLGVILTGCVKKCVVTFDANGGNFEGGDLIITQKVKTSKQVLKPSDPVRAGGYIFQGWYKEKTTKNAWDFGKDVVDKDITLFAKWGTYTSETYDFKTPQTDTLKLKSSYEGKKFETDGIGVVEAVRYVDGDTTMFTSGGSSFTVRYNGINTPESTYRIEAWGFAASQYNKSQFKQAKADGAKIVLEAEKPGETDSNGRYLAWVWFVYPNGDSKLLNLELAELAYAQVKSATGTKYETYLNDAIKDLVVYGLRIYGEKDPNYDYSKTATVMSIKEIREQYGTAEAIDNARNEFTSPLIEVTGVEHYL